MNGYKSVNQWFSSSMGKLFSKRKDRSQSSHRRNTPRAHEHNSPLETGRQASVSMVKTHTPVHSDAVVSLSTVQTGLCLSGSKDKTVALYDYHSYNLKEKWTGHEREITKVRYGVGCQAAFSASRDKTIKMWKRGQPSPVQEFIGHDLVVTAIDVNKDNKLLCSGSRDNTVRLWDVERGTCVMENNIHRNLVTDVKFVPGTDLMVQTGEDKEVRLLDVKNLVVVHNFPRKQYIQMCCDVSPCGNYCLTCSNGFSGNGCEATLWDLRSRKIVHEYKGHSEAIESCIFLPFVGKDLIATSSRDCSIKIWDRDSKQCLTETFLAGAGPLTSLMCYDNSSMCVSSFNTGIHQLHLSLANTVLEEVATF